MNVFFIEIFYEMFIVSHQDLGEVKFEKGHLIQGKWPFSYKISLIHRNSWALKKLNEEGNSMKKRGDDAQT